jgi:gas vesicle protein
VTKRDEGGFLAGLLVGGLVGAALALLYTPRSGRENRQALLARAGVLAGQRPEALLERSRSALRARFQQAAGTPRAATADDQQPTSGDARTEEDGTAARS